MIEYKLMTQEHVVPVAEIEKICFSDPWSVASVTSELSNPLSLWLVAEDNGVVAGYIGSQTVLGESDMLNLAVLPGYRRQGVGKRLVTELINRLSKKDVYRLTLEVRVSNEAAISLYNSMGFQPVGIRPNYYRNPREDAYLMRKEW